MGLDNGIVLKVSDKKFPEDFPIISNNNDESLWWIDSPEDVAKKGEMHVVYWRKCWGIRDSILTILHVDKNGGGHYVVEAEDLPAIRRALTKFLKPDYYEAYADSIWEYDEMVEPIINNLLCLLWL